MDIILYVLMICIATVITVLGKKVLPSFYLFIAVIIWFMLSLASYNIQYHLLLRVNETIGTYNNIYDYEYGYVSYYSIYLAYLFFMIGLVVMLDAIYNILISFKRGGR